MIWIAPSEKDTANAALEKRLWDEDQLVEQPAIGLFAELGWTTVSAAERLNSSLPPEAITTAADELTRDRSTMSRFSGQVNLKTN